MTGRTVEFLFDFGSPNAFLAHRVIPEVERRTGAVFVYVPVLLGGVFKATGNQSPASAYAQIPSKLAYEHLEMDRFAQRHRIEFAMNPHFPVNTLALMRGAVAAARLELFDAYVEAIFRFMWIEGRKLDDPDVLRASLQEALGPQAEALLGLSQAPDVKAMLVAHTEAAVARGVFGLPTFFLGDEMWFGKDRLLDVEEALEEAQLSRRGSAMPPT